MSGTHACMNLYSSSALFFGTLNQYSGLIFFLPYDMSGVDLEIGLNIGLPIRSRKYSGGSSEGLAGLGINSEKTFGKVSFRNCRLQSCYKAN